jgi:hypothetical protein
MVVAEQRTPAATLTEHCSGHRDDTAAEDEYAAAVECAEHLWRSFWTDLANDGDDHDTTRVPPAAGRRPRTSPR